MTSKFKLMTIFYYIFSLWLTMWQQKLRGKKTDKMMGPLYYFLGNEMTYAQNFNAVFNYNHMDVYEYIIYALKIERGVVS